MAALLAIVVALILYGTLAPFHFEFAGHPGNPVVYMLHSWPGRIDRAVIRDGLLNIAIFLPLGATACLTFARHWKRRPAFLLAVAHGSALSACIEIFQFYERTRYSSAADWLCNTLGALAGAALALVFQRRLEALTSGAERRGAGAGLLLATCWMGAQLYPLLPYFTTARIGASWTHLMATRFSWVEIIAGAAGWFVFGLALRAVWGKLPWAWLALTMFAVPLRLVIADRVVTRSDIAAALAGLALWCLTRDSVREGVGWLLLLAAIVLRELAPFHFGPAHPFSWRPFGATMAAEHGPGISVILRKAFEYGAMVWLLTAGKLRYRTAAIVVAVALAGMELLQTRMPGRQPEITDSVLALLMALFLRMLSS